jgi:integrase
MSVRKRILPSGEIRWLAGYNDGSGARRFKQFKKKGEAEAFYNQTAVDVRAGLHTPDSASITVAEAGELWLTTCRTGGPEGEPLETGTLRQYRQHLDLHIAPFIGGTKLSRLSAPAVEKYKDTLRENGRSAIMVRKISASLKAILSEAMRRGHVRINAADQAKGRRRRRAAREDTRCVIPEKAELLAMMAKAAELWPVSSAEVSRKGERRIITLPWRPLIVTAIFTGLRISELRGLIWENVDFDRKLIVVCQRADFRNVIGKCKSNAGYRDVPMAPLVINTLREWRLACPKTNLGLVFPTGAGGIASNVGILRYVWRPLLRALDLVSYDDDGKEVPKYVFHYLRHAAASLMIEQGWQPKKIQTVMGHSSIQVTYDIYGHLFASPDDDATAMAQIEARLFS